MIFVSRGTKNNHFWGYIKKTIPFSILSCSINSPDGFSEGVQGGYEDGMGVILLCRKKGQGVQVFLVN